MSNLALITLLALCQMEQADSKITIIGDDGMLMIFPYQDGYIISRKNVAYYAETFQIAINETFDNHMLAFERYQVIVRRNVVVNLVRDKVTRQYHLKMSEKPEIGLLDKGEINELIKKHLLEMQSNRLIF